MLDGLAVLDGADDLLGLLWRKRGARPPVFL
jgi:hypothetical protein